MKILIGSRGSGKTTELLKIANKETAIFVCRHEALDVVRDMAAQMGLTDILGFWGHRVSLTGISVPIVIDDFDYYGELHVRFECIKDLYNHLIAVSQSNSTMTFFTSAYDEIIDLDKIKRKKCYFASFSYTSDSARIHSVCFLFKGKHPLIAIKDYCDDGGCKLMSVNSYYEIDHEVYADLSKTFPKIEG